MVLFAGWRAPAGRVRSRIVYCFKANFAQLVFLVTSPITILSFITSSVAQTIMLFRRSRSPSKTRLVTIQTRETHAPPLAHSRGCFGQHPFAQLPRKLFIG